MIRYVQGDLLKSEAEALVNAVNTVGVMGKGIALQFKKMFPENYRKYVHASKNGELKTGKMFITEEHLIDGKKWIVNFPTKEHWSRASKYEWVEEGLEDLVRIIAAKQIKSIAIPPLGCGNGKLKWGKVKEMIEASLGKLEQVDIQIFAPKE